MILTDSFSNLFIKHVLYTHHAYIERGNKISTLKEGPNLASCEGIVFTMTALCTKGCENIEEGQSLTEHFVEGEFELCLKDKIKCLLEGKEIWRKDIVDKRNSMGSKEVIQKLVPGVGCCIIKI